VPGSLKIGRAAGAPSAFDVARILIERERGRGKGNDLTFANPVYAVQFPQRVRYEALVDLGARTAAARDQAAQPGLRTRAIVAFVNSASVYTVPSSETIAKFTNMV
jgi:hypothetical protein